jgi:hypothetical protein
VCLGQKVFGAIRLGASGRLLKNSIEKTLHTAIYDLRRSSDSARTFRGSPLNLTGHWLAAGVSPLPVAARKLAGMSSRTADTICSSIPP